MHMHHRWTIIVSVFLTIVSFTSCKDGEEANLPLCTGRSCLCESGQACTIDESECAEDSCSLDCTDHNECTGECGTSCSIDCAGMSTCDVTLGQSGSLSCTGGSTCHVTCTAECSVSCSDDSTCALSCGTGGEPIVVTGSGQCG
jgi:hypothetical protein